MRIEIVMCGKTNKKGFTLAETLITLMIIGVIASLTIPALRKRSEQQEIITGIKKNYSALAQAVSLSEVDNGSLRRWNFNLTSEDFFNEYLAPYLNITSVCKGSDACWGGQLYDVTGAVILSADTYRVVLADGTRFGIQLQSAEDYAHLFVDVNGTKKPNTYGSDVFAFTLAKKGFTDYAHNVPERGLYVFGTGISRAALYSGCKSNGNMCAGLIASDGWQILKDYPF